MLRDGTRLCLVSFYFECIIELIKVCVFIKRRGVLCAIMLFAIGR